MGLDLWLTLAVLAGALYLFVTEKLPVDVVALLVLCSLLVLGLVSPREALSGFSNPATLTVAAMFVLSAGLQRSGALRTLGELLARIRLPWLFALVMMVLVGGISAFVNNTAAVAVFLPLVIAAATARRWAPSKFLIPLSFAAQFGGVCTLMGTSTNLLVDSLARQSGGVGFTIFEFAPLGIIFVFAGVTYLMLAGRFLLPDLGTPAIDSEGHMGRFVVELVVGGKSSSVGKRVDALEALQGEVEVLEVLRERRALPSPGTAVLEPQDRLLVRGEWLALETARKRAGLSYDRVASDLDGDAATERLHAEVMVAPGSHLVGQTLAAMRFGHTYRARVHGMHRQRLAIRRPLDQVPLAVGDVLLIDAPDAAIDELRNDRGMIVLGKRLQMRVDVRRATVSLLVLVAVVGMAAIGWMPIVAAAILGGVALVVTNCLEPDEAYAAIDWRVIVLLAGVLPLGIALQNSGGAAWVAQQAIQVIGPFGPVATLAAIYLLTAVMTEVMSNNAAAVLVVPIAIATAEAMGVDTKPFLVAVAFAASTAFATPVGYQTNTMVYTAGGYRFNDFLRIGLPLNLLFWIMAVLLIPRFFPF